MRFHCAHNKTPLSTSFSRNTSKWEKENNFFPKNRSKKPDQMKPTSCLLIKMLRTPEEGHAGQIQNPAPPKEQQPQTSTNPDRSPNTQAHTLHTPNTKYKKPKKKKKQKPRKQEITRDLAVPHLWIIIWSEKKNGARKSTRGGGVGLGMEKKKRSSDGDGDRDEVRSGREEEGLELLLSKAFWRRRCW